MESKRLMWVETESKREMQAFFCKECNSLFEPHAFWSIGKSLAMHLRGTGHKGIIYLKVDEVEVGEVRIIGTAQEGVTLYEVA